MAIYSCLAGGLRSICEEENQSLTEQPLGQPISGVITLSAADRARSVHVHPSVYVLLNELTGGREGMI